MHPDATPAFRMSSPLMDGNVTVGLVFVSAVSVGGVFGVAAYVLRMLSVSGALAGGLFAALLVGAGGWAWIVPGVVFFAGSSALSKVDSRRKADASRRAEKGSVRDAGQVLANGGVAMGALVAFALGAPPDAAYAAFVGALAAAAADTWATELGTLSTTPPVSLGTLRRVPVGTSGAVSPAGTLASVGGAASVAGAALVVAGTSLGSGSALGAPAAFGVGTALLATLAGVTGAFVDSVAGATVQARFHDPVAGGLTERRPADRPTPVRGWRWVDNDVVNLLCTATGAAVMLAWTLG